MARNERTIPVDPSIVWDVLTDPYAYPQWVVGTDRTLEADTEWPLPGSKFKVHVALGYSDYTHAVEVEPERRIVLHVAGGPFGAARVEISLASHAGGTRVTIVEDPATFMRPFRWFPPMQLAIKLRNVESLKRLGRIAEARAALPPHPPVASSA